MSYTVLARKFRSQTFDEIVGQPTIVATLENAIGQDRVHHGYLFFGTRGVGKTSMARILAKSLNCLAGEGPTTRPCGQCDSCVNVARGEDVDVVEIDAASHTGVDNVRELRSNAVYRPARSRFKIYIIDEVHMLSKGAFNALLKTLEEPPDHVKFIFATTEANKVPATILSRVQQFEFKSIPTGEIAEQLNMICKAEEVTIDEAARKRLARLANGSMRDALSLLDQVLSMAGKDITAQIVDELFPAAHDELFSELIDRLAAGNPAEALAVADRSLGQGATLDTWCAHLIGQLRDLMIMRVCGKDTDLVDVPAELRNRLAEQSKQFDGGGFTYMITVLEEVRRSVKTGGGSRALIEAAIIRMAEASKFSSIESLLAEVQSGPRPADPGAKKKHRTAAK
jgi:DNA polymerase-3 subunit gamma/tau